MSPQKRNAIPEPELARLVAALASKAAADAVADAADEEVRASVVAALLAGGSVRAVAEEARISRSTAEVWGKAGGWPSAEQKAAWNRRREDSAALRRAIERHETE